MSKTKLAVYARLTAAICDADRRATHFPTSVNARINSVHHFAEVYAANAEVYEAALGNLVVDKAADPSPVGGAA